MNAEDIKMLNMTNVDHVGIRISSRQKSLPFFELLGFKLIADGGFEAGHPLILAHPSGVVLNLLGPATGKQGENVLMDEDTKFPGITHVAFKMSSAEETEAFIVANNITITGRHTFRGITTIFIRDPDRNVLELVGPGPSITDQITDDMHD